VPGSTRRLLSSPPAVGIDSHIQRACTLLCVSDRRLVRGLGRDQWMCYSPAVSPGHGVIWGGRQLLRARTKGHRKQRSACAPALPCPLPAMAAGSAGRRRPASPRRNHRCTTHHHPSGGHVVQACEIPARQGRHLPTVGIPRRRLALARSLDGVPTWCLVNSEHIPRPDRQTVYGPGGVDVLSGWLLEP
jgi:hypothetical protein